MSWLKIILLGILGLFLTVVLLIASVTATNSGLRLLFSVAGYFLPTLKVGAITGSVIKGFMVDGFSFHADSIDVTIKSLSAQAWLSKRTVLVVPQITVDSPAITLKKINQPVDDTPYSNTQIELPIGIRIDNVIINNAALELYGTSLGWEKLQLSASMEGHKLHLKPSRIDNIALTLSDAQEDTDTKASNNPKKQQGMKLNLSDIVLPLDIQVDLIEIFHFTIDSGEPQVIDMLRLSGKTKKSRIEISTFDVRSSLGDMDVKGNMRLKGNYPLSVEIKASAKKAPMEHQTFDFSAQGSLQNLVVKSVLKGRLQATLDATLQLTQDNMPLTLSLNTQSLMWPLDDNPDYELSDSQLTLNGNLSNYDLTFSGHAQGEQIPDTDIRMKASGNLDKVAIDYLQLTTLSGDITAKADASWSPFISVDSDIEIKGINPEEQWPFFKGNLGGEIKLAARQSENNQWKVNLSPLRIEGVINDQPLSITGKLDADVSDVADTTLQIRDMAFSHGSNHIKLTGSLDKTWQLKAQVNMPELGKTVPGVEGSVIGHVNVTGDVKTPDIAVDMDISSLAFKDQFSAHQMKLSGNLSLADDVNSDLVLSIEQVKASVLSFSTLHARFKGNPSNHHFKMSMAGEPVDWQLDMTGHLDKENVWSGKITASDGKFAESRFLLKQPINIIVSPEKVEISKHCWQQGGGSLCLLDDASLGSTGQIKAKIANLDIGNLLAPFLPENTTLTTKLNANVSAQWQNKQVKTLIGAVDLTPGDYRQKISNTLFVVGWNQCHVSLNNTGQLLKSQVAINLRSNGRLEGEFTLDRDSDKNTIAGKLDIKDIQLSPLKPLLPSYEQLGGVVKSHMRFTGTIAEPNLTGSLSIENILATGRDAPLTIEKGNIGVSLSQQKATIKGQLFNEGTPLNIDGRVDWHQNESWVLALNVKGDNLKIQKKPELSMKLQPDIQLTVSPKMVEVNGKVAIPRARVLVQRLPQSAVQVSKDEVIVNSQLQPVDQTKEIPFNIKSNIFLAIGDDVKIQALGLKTDLLGKLSIRMKENTPLIFGELFVKNGTYRAFGQSLVIQEGRLSFNGPVDQPYLSIKAIRDPKAIQDDVIAGIRVTGSADKPEVTIFSEPPMPQQNALSYILTGKDIDQDMDASASATIMLISMGLAKSNQMVGNIGESLGIKDLSLDAEGAGDESQVTVSGYIAPGLEVKYGMGVFEAIAEFTVRYELLRDLFVEAVSSDDDTSLDLLYRFSF